jgi:hypothetical protein
VTIPYKEHTARTEIAPSRPPSEIYLSQQPALAQFLDESVWPSSRLRSIITGSTSTGKSTLRRYFLAHEPLAESHPFVVDPRDMQPVTVYGDISGDSTVSANTPITLVTADITRLTNVLAGIFTTLDATTVAAAFTAFNNPPDPLAGFSAYNQANWDGFDAEPITKQTVAAARRLIGNLPHTYGAADIAPGADGTIGFEWHPEPGPLKKLYIDVGPGAVWRAYWQRKNGESGHVAKKPVDIAIETDLKDLFDHLSA